MEGSRFDRMTRRASLTTLGAAGLAGFMALAHPLTGDAKKHKHRRIRVDAKCPVAIDDAFGLIDVNGRLAHTFTAIRSGSLFRAELRITRPAGSLGNYVLRLSPVNGAGAPTNTVLAETTVPDSAVPNGQSTVTFPFSYSNLFPVVAGTTYALVLTRPGSDKLVWAGHTGNDCAGTAYMSPSQNAPFVAVGNIDFNFTTYVRS